LRQIFGPAREARGPRLLSLERYVRYVPSHPHHWLNGSGKTHVACLLSRRLRIPTFDLDDLFWDRSASTYGIRATGDLRDRKLAEIVTGEAWIIEGVYHQWLGPSFDRAQVILALTPPVWVRDVRVIRRFIKRKLGLVPSKRESIRDLWQLLQWNHKYDHDNYPRAMAFIRERNRVAVECKSLQDVMRAVIDSTQPAA
jgi:adenylate kinase family enzyme